MSVFKDYEREVLSLLAAGALSPELMETVVGDGVLVSYEYSGCGYFLTVAHPCLPAQRMVCSDPMVTGHAEGIACGFVVFIEDRELTLECHPWGAIDVPEDFREKDVRVEIENDADPISNR